MPGTSSRPLRNLYALACLVVVVAALYFARSVLIPLVLAVLLAFLLSPLMLAIERRGLKRLPAAAAVVLLTLLLLAGAGLLVTAQLRGLMSDLPRHRESIVAKVEALRDSASESWLSGVATTLSEVRERLAEAREEEGEKPTPVEIVPSRMAFAHSTIGPLADSLLAGGLVLVLTFFMLLRREEMRDRLIRLCRAPGGCRAPRRWTTPADGSARSC
ncbi:MAG: AI-2E family transporter [Gemmataceae bacterium]